MKTIQAVALCLGLSACAAAPPPVVVPCPQIDASLFRAGELPDGLPEDPGEAVLALWRAYRERGAALEAIRELLQKENADDR